MAETDGERRYYKCSVGAGRCGNVVQPAKYNNNNNRFSNSLLNIIIIIIIDLAIPASYSLHYAMAEKLQKYAALTGIRRLKTANIILQNGHYTKQVTRNCDVSYFVHSLTSITSSIFQTNARNIHNTYIFTKSLLQVSVCYTSSSCREQIVLSN